MRKSTKNPNGQYDLICELNYIARFLFPTKTLHFYASYGMVRLDNANEKAVVLIGNLTKEVSEMPNKDMLWQGMITVKNIQQIVQFLNTLLWDEYYTFTVEQEYFSDKEPEIRPRQKLEKEIEVYYSGDACAYFIMTDGAGVRSCSTNLLEDKDDPDLANPHCIIEQTRVTIKFRSDTGYKLVWTMELEERE